MTWIHFIDFALQVRNVKLLFAEKRWTDRYAYIFLVLRITHGPPLESRLIKFLCNIWHCVYLFCCKGSATKQTFREKAQNENATLYAYLECLSALTGNRIFLNFAFAAVQAQNKILVPHAQAFGTKLITFSITKLSKASTQCHGIRNQIHIVYCFSDVNDCCANFMSEEATCWSCKSAIELIAAALNPKLEENQFFHALNISFIWGQAFIEVDNESLLRSLSGEMNVSHAEWNMNELTVKELQWKC